MEYYHHVPPPFRGYGVIPPPAPPQLSQLHPQPHLQQHIPPQSHVPQPQQFQQQSTIPTDVTLSKPNADAERPKKKKRYANDVNTEWLIEEVKKRPACHYLRGTGSEIDENEQGWNEISQVMAVSVDSLKKKWQYLRSGFMRTHRALLINSTEKVRENALKWKYYEPLQFLVSQLALNNKYFSEAIETMGNEANEPLLPSEESGPENDSKKPKERAPRKPKVVRTPKKKRKIKARKRKLLRKQLEMSSSNDDADAFGGLSSPCSPLPDEVPSPSQLYVLAEMKSTVKKRRRRQTKVPVTPDAVNDRLLEIILQRVDSDQKFLLSLLPNLKRLTLRRNVQAKMMMQQTLNNLVYSEEKSDARSMRSKNNHKINNFVKEIQYPLLKKNLIPKNKVSIARLKR